MATAASNRSLAAAPQSQSKEVLLKSYTKRLKDDIKSMVDNYTEILRLCKFEDDGNVLAQVSRYKSQISVSARLVTKSHEGTGRTDGKKNILSGL